MGTSAVLRRVEAPSYFNGGQTAYVVEVEGHIVGSVTSHRTESWRSLPSGVRYGYRGSPKHWEAHVHERAEDAERFPDGGRRVGYRFSTRAGAVAHLLERAGMVA